MEADRQEFFQDIDLRPTQNLIVRVNAKIDTLTGIFEWQFTSLDPLTRQLTTDVDAGFLPPIKSHRREMVGFTSPRVFYLVQ